MTGLTNALLSTVDRASRRLAPLNNLVDGIVERVVPHTTAKAYFQCPAGYGVCSSRCTWDMCRPFRFTRDLTVADEMNTCAMGGWYCNMCDC